MKQKNYAILVLSLILLCSAVSLGAGDSAETVPFSFLIDTQNGEEKIHYWESTPGTCYVLLPGHAKMSGLRIQTQSTVLFDDIELKNGEICETLQLNHSYKITGADNLDTITFVQSQNIPAMYMDTESGNMDYIHKEKGNEERGSVRLYGCGGDLECWSTFDSLETRGNASFYGKKKPYNLKLSSRQDLLGMGAARKWILLANAYDATQLKNKLVFDFSADIGLPYSPESRWVDLYLNGNYAGVYLLCERNEVAPNRVEIPKGEGFLLSKEQKYNLEGTDKPYFATDAGVLLRVRSNSMEDSQMEAIIQSAENAILAEDGMDPVTGRHWTELIDLDSWIRKYLVEEIFGGIDAGVASQFFYYKQDPGGGKLFAGPVWDYDGSMNAVIGLADDMPVIMQIPEIFYAHRSRECPWFHSLYYHETFYNSMTELFRQEVSGVLNDYIHEKIPSYVDQIRQAARMNQIRWNCDDLQSSAEFVQQYLAKRLEFLLDVWTSSGKYHEVHVDYFYEGLDCEYVTFDYAVLSGACMREIPDMQPYDWYIAGTEIPFDRTKPIYEEMGIELRGKH